MGRPWISWITSNFAACLIAGVGLSLIGCTPSVGDKCTLATDCSQRGDRVCDNSQPGGYCTIFNCQRASCPEEAMCVLFNASVPGCAYDDRTIARTARSYCMFMCSNDGDCREGYACADARNPPWNAALLDDVGQSIGVCLAKPMTGNNVSTGKSGDSSSPVCSSGGVSSIQPIEAGTALVDASTDSGDSGSLQDAAIDGSSDGGVVDASSGD